MRWPAITRNNDFRRAYARGRSYVGDSIVLYVCKNRARCTRLGITCSKKIGNAVQRNRARRVIRAASAAVLPPSGVGGYDLVIVARAAATRQKSTQVAAALTKLLQAAGLCGRSAKKNAAQNGQPARQEENAGQGGQPAARASHAFVQREETPCPPLPHGPYTDA